MFFQSSTSGVSVTELLTKDGHNVTQSGVTNLLLRNGMTTRKGLLEFQGKKGEIFDYYFLPASVIINPVPKNGTADDRKDADELAVTARTPFQCRPDLAHSFRQLPSLEGSSVS